MAVLGDFSRIAMVALGRPPAVRWRVGKHHIAQIRDGGWRVCCRISRVGDRKADVVRRRAAIRPGAEHVSRAVECLRKGAANVRWMPTTPTTLSGATSG